jgi:zinc D-Ala-D-Ala dipeptidase
MKIFRYIILTLACMSSAYSLPSGFVYLHDVDASILQEMRYAGFHNFMGRPVQGYKAKECILTKQAALALSAVQTELKKSSLSLKVYDCYRPTRAVADFIAWSKEGRHQEMKEEFYPHVNKADVFRLGYVAERSGHSRGSTMDLTIVALPAALQPLYRPGQQLVSCTSPYNQRYHDNSIDMGTGFDCLDELSHALYKNIDQSAYRHRMLLRHIMIKYGFQPYGPEWWHFTLQDEPCPHAYFNFVVRAY